MMRRAVPFLILALAVPARADDFFETKVRPALAEHCYACHSQKAKKIKGGLLLDSRETLLKGGDSGQPAIVPGEPAKSLLIEAISYKNVDLTMPPRGKLPDNVIADLTAWVKSGAAWPLAPLAKSGDAKKYDFDLARRKAEHWPWQPVRPQSPPAGVARQARIDRFLVAGIDAKGLTPADPAPPRVLLRRLYFDLIGLPPTPEQCEAFEKACAGSGRARRAALEKSIDDLL